MGLEFRELFESAPARFCVLSPDLTIIAVTDEYVRAAMRPRRQLIGRFLFDVFPDNPADPHDGVKNLRVSLERVIRERAVDTMPIQRYDVRAPDSEGGGFETRYWRPVNTPLFNDEGALSCIIHAVEDVTRTIGLEAEIRDEHERLVEAVRALEASNEELEAFCYSVAHDLRAPLRGIQGFSQALLEDYATTVDAKGQGYLQRVSSAALRMSELIDDLLTLSRISRTPLSRGAVDVTAIAAEVAAHFARERQVGIAIEDDMRATADARLVQIVFENLLGNAWKFTGKVGHPSVAVGTTVIDGATAFFVRDNGAGFDEAYASKLFAPFQRLHSDKEFAGTGIGLAIVQRIVRRHGGRAWAHGVIDEGATFYFTLPE
jgi:signal transduction histidine kinase